MKYNIMEYNEKIKSLVNKPSKTQMDETLKTIFDWHDKALEQNKNITDDISVSITLQTLDGARISNLADNKEMPIEYGDEYSIDLENSGFIVFSENPTEFPLSKYVDISKIKKPIIISASELIKFCKITDMDLEFYNNRFYLNFRPSFQDYIEICEYMDTFEKCKRNYQQPSSLRNMDKKDSLIQLIDEMSSINMSLLTQRRQKITLLKQYLSLLEVQQDILESNQRLNELLEQIQTFLADDDISEELGTPLTYTKHNQK